MLGSLQLSLTGAPLVSLLQTGLGNALVQTRHNHRAPTLADPAVQEWRRQRQHRFWPKSRSTSTALRPFTGEHCAPNGNLSDLGDLAAACAAPPSAWVASSRTTSPMPLQDGKVSVGGSLRLQRGHEAGDRGCVRHRVRAACGRCGEVHAGGECWDNGSACLLSGGHAPLWCYQVDAGWALCWAFSKLAVLCSCPAAGNGSREQVRLQDHSVDAASWCCHPAPLCR